MKNVILATGIALFTLCGCKSKTEEQEAMTVKQEALKLQIQGHRGERGNLPENSIPAFLGALRKGVDVLELDVVISKDNQVVVSHEPFMLPLYMLTPEGDSIPQIDEKKYNLYQMDYAEIKQFDGGSKGNVRFPQQQKMKTYKPLLSEVFDTVAATIKAEGLKPVKFNIEIKSEVPEYDVFQPQPAAFVDIVMQVIKEKKAEDKINIQSFDPEILEVMHQNYPHIELAYLVGEGNFSANLKRLTFETEIYSPHFKLLDSTEVAAIHNKNMKVIPWTVNEPEAIKEVIDLKVDGIITDYPERVLEALKNEEYSVNSSGLKIQELKLYTTRLPDQRLFYSETLGLDVFDETNDQFSVKMGASVLVFKQRETATPYHFAITIPAGKEQEALSWLKPRVEVLKNSDNEIQYFENWDAKAIYFYDADHNIVEFISRNTLNNQTSDAFSKAQLVEISEIGLPTDAIEQSFITLNKTLGLEVYDGNFERFCAVGDEHGLIICIDKNSRKWFPTDDTAYPSDFEVRTAGGNVDYSIIFRDENLSIEPIQS